MTNYAYIRVSTQNQNHQSQKYGILNYANKNNLTKLKIIADTCTGSKKPSERKLGKLIADMAKGDNLIITEVSRLGRSLRDVIEVLEIAKEKGAAVHVIKQGLVLAENGNTAGKLVVAMYSVFAEMEHELIKQRVQEGIDSARARGVRFGRPKGWHPKLKLDEKESEIMALLPLKMSNAHMARTFSVSPQTMKLWLKRHLDKPKKSRHSPTKPTTTSKANGKT